MPQAALSFSLWSRILSRTTINLDNRDADFLDAMEQHPVSRCTGTALQTIRRIFEDLEMELGLDSMPSNVPLPPCSLYW